MKCRHAPASANYVHRVQGGRHHRACAHWPRYLFEDRRTLYYRGQQFRSLKGTGFKANYYEVGSGDEYWISGCKKSGGDRLYSGTVEIDEDVREEYWVQIRNRPESKDARASGRSGKYSVT